MTISVTRNSNGTITIACGGETMTIAGSTASDPPVQPQQASGEIAPFLWPNHQTTAAIVAGGKAKTEIVIVPSVEALLKAIREKHDLHAKAQKPIIFQFHVMGDKPLRVESINKVVSDLGHPDWMGMQIKLTGLRDE
jgi:hypothetical protein